MNERFRLEEGWSTFFMLLGLLIIAGTAIMQSDLIPGLQIIPIVAITAVIFGLLIAKSQFTPNTAHLYAFLYGCFFVLYFVGTTLDHNLLWRERIIDILTRQAIWLNKAVNGGTSRDGLIFVIQTSAIFWLLGYSAAWYTFRFPRVWRAIVPTGLVLLSVVYYYNGPKPLPYYLAAYILLGLVYISRTYLNDQERLWRTTAVRYEKGIRYTFSQAAFLVGLCGLVFSWSLPALAANTTINNLVGGPQGPWHEFQDNWTRLFASLRSYGTGATDPYQDTLTLGGPRSIGNTPVMDIYVPHKLDYVYWEAIVYDTYTNGSWSAAEGETTLHFPDDGALLVPYNLSREVITQTVINYLPNSSILYGAPEIVNSDRQMFVDATHDEKGNALVSALRARFALRQGEIYHVTSRQSRVTASDLRQATTQYPTWVTERYLQVPDTLTPETLALAQELTAGYENPFDKAIAVRDYLRKNIKYNDQIQAAPEGVDSVHYVLFMIKEGYCNYYASAMALMLRSQGVPARIVSGYAQGEYDEATGSYRVRASNAHTWVEVYFPDYGWIQFEPTASLPAGDRPEGEGGGGDGFNNGGGVTQPPTNRDDLLGENDNTDVERADNLTAGEDANESGVQGFLANFPIWRAVGAFLVLLIAGGLLWVGNEMNKRVEGDIHGSYGRLGDWAQWLGILFRPVHTPYERAELMVTAVPEGSQSIRTLVQNFVLQQFSPAHTTGEDFNPQKEWQQLRPLLLKQAIMRQLQRFRRSS